MFFRAKNLQLLNDRKINLVLIMNEFFINYKGT